MNDPAQTSGAPSDRARILNYSLRHAKIIERKMMGEAFERLSPITPLTTYRYVGFGSEFFNDFALYHQKMGIRDMVSIERDEERIERCEFNQPYKCVKVIKGTATQVLPQLDWRRPAIVWLDYVDKLNKIIVDDIRFQYRRFRYQDIAQNDTPTITLQGSFNAGGNNGGTVKLASTSSGVNAWSTPKS